MGARTVGGRIAGDSLDVVLTAVQQGVNDAGALLAGRVHDGHDALRWTDHGCRCCRG